MKSPKMLVILKEIGEIFVKKIEISAKIFEQVVGRARHHEKF